MKYAGAMRLIGLDVRVLAIMSGVLNGEDDNLLGLFIGSVIDQIAVAPRHKLAHALDFLLPPNTWKQDKALKRFKDGGADAKRRCRILFTDIRRWQQGLAPRGA